MWWIALARWLLKSLRWLFGSKEGRIALLAVLAVATFLEYGHRRFSAGVTAERTRWEAKADRAKVDAAVAQLDAYMAGAKRMAVIGQTLEKNNADALAEKDRLITDLRRGTIRLQPRFTCPVGPSAPASIGDGEAPAGFTAADAEIAFGIAADGDAAVRQLIACQAVIEADRQ